MIIFLGVIVGFGISGILLYHSKWANEKCDSTIGTSGQEFKFEPDSENNLIASWLECKDYIFLEYNISCEIESGRLQLIVYDTHEDYDINKQFSYTEVHRYEIVESGTYNYDLSDLPNGYYNIVLEPIEEDTIASGSQMYITHLNNWSAMLSRLGMLE